MLCCFIHSLPKQRQFVIDQRWDFKWGDSSCSSGRVVLAWSMGLISVIKFKCLTPSYGDGEGREFFLPSTFLECHEYFHLTHCSCRDLWCGWHPWIHFSCYFAFMFCVFLKFHSNYISSIHKPVWTLDPASYDSGLLVLPLIKLLADKSTCEFTKNSFHYMRC